MNYEKPEVVRLDSAIAAIQAQGKTGSEPDDALNPTATAYEADE